MRPGSKEGRSFKTYVKVKPGASLSFVHAISIDECVIAHLSRRRRRKRRRRRRREKRRRRRDFGGKSSSEVVSTRCCVVSACSRSKIRRR
jgi:hypothetical protein